MDAPSFAHDIRPLFRERDRIAMEFAFDLWDHAEVRDNAEGIYDRIDDGSMPCDAAAAWAAERLALLRHWIDAGCPA
jgi:hypothetical protein